MKRPFSSKLSEPLRRRVDLAVAVAQERLLGTHVTYALDLITLVEGRVPFDDALDIYARMARLSAEEAGIVSTRALATLGRETGSRPERSEQADGAADEEEGGDDESAGSFLAQLRQRLRGRINEELRFMIELEGARAEEALLYTHVENALSFVDLLDEEMTAPESVDLYIDALEVRDSSAEVVYHLTLARLAERVLPEGHRARKRSPAVHGGDAAPGERRLHLVEGDGGA